MKKAKNNKKNISSKKSDITDLKISDAVSRISKNTFILPLFQRGYVWDSEKITSLLNSLYNNYPIGSITLAETDKTVQYSFEKNPIFNIGETQNKGKKYAILDGQQRLTSLGLLINYNLISDNNKVSASEFTTKCIEQIDNIFFLKDEEDVSGNVFFTKKYLRSKNSHISKSVDISHFSLRHTSIRDEVIKEISKSKLHFFVVKKLEKRKMIDFFEKINTNSAKLTNIDMLSAHFLIKNESNNSQNKKNKKPTTDHQQKSLLELLNEILSNDPIKQFGLSHDLVMQIWKMYFDLSSKKENEVLTHVDISIKSVWSDVIEMKSGDVNNEEKLLRFSRLRVRVENGILTTIKYLEEILHFYSLNSIPNISFLMNIAAYVYNGLDDNKLAVKDKISDDVKKNIHIIASHSLGRTLKGDYKAGTANKINEDIKSIINGEIKSKLKFDDYKEIVNESIKNAKYSAKLTMFKIAMSVLIGQKPQSLIKPNTNVQATNDKWFTDISQYHHFLPIGYKGLDEFFTSNANEIKNSIRNIVLIDGDENNHINNKSPFEYLSVLKTIDKYHAMVNDLEESHLFLRNDLIKIVDYKNMTGDDKEQMSEKAAIIDKVLTNRFNRISEAIIDKYFDK